MADHDFLLTLFKLGLYKPPNLNLMPDPGRTYDIGASTKTWEDVYMNLNNSKQSTPKVNSK